MGGSFDDMEMYSGLVEDHIDGPELSDKEIEILKYCRGKTQYMWAARIVGIVLDCDFRDAEQELRKIWRGIN
jgi:hypothetical protein